MAHCNTIFHSMLKFIPRHQFEILEIHHSTGRKARQFSRWSQFVHLMFMQLTGRVSLPASLQTILRVVQLNLFRKCNWEELFKPPPLMGKNKRIIKQLSLNFG